MINGLPWAAEKSISGCGWDRADIQRSLSLLKEKNKDGCIFCHFYHFCVVITNTDIPATVSISYCVSVLSSRDLCDMCSRNRFFCKEWSFTRQFSTRSSDTGEWSITVNLPPLERADSKISKDKWKCGRKNCDKIEGTIKDCRYEENRILHKVVRDVAVGDGLF